jgi:hypothetical protein
MRTGPICCALLLAGLVGCGPALPTTPRTGAEETARDYFEALRQADWTGAYGKLDPESRAHLNGEVFARTGADYRQRLGFEPETLHIRSCQERGDEATAHIVFAGHADGQYRQFKDAAVLRRSASGWGVVLPQRSVWPR